MSEVVISLLAFSAAVLALARAWIDHRGFIRRVRQLEQEVQQARQALKRRSDLANEVAHEIKNPLTAILCSAETLELLIGPGLNETNLQSLRYIREYGDNLLRLVSDFLDVSRAEQAHLHARPEEVRLLPAIKAITGLLKGSAVKKRIALELLSLEKDPLVWIDPAHLKQIIFNLLHNAIKFAPQGGRIQVVVKNTFPDRYVSIAVQDNGPGIPPEILPHIFDLYTTGGGARRPFEVGTGLGLALCRALVQLAGGDISAQSLPGRGTSLEFTVLQHNPQEDSSSTAGADSSDELQKASLQGQRFLVVDKDQGARESIAGLLSAWGAMVDQVAKASEAVKAICQTDYSAIITDDCADGVSARELAQAVRSHGGKSATRIVIASQGSLPQEQQECDAFVEKPLNGKTLLESLRSHKH